MKDSRPIPYQEDTVSIYAFIDSDTGKKLYIGQAVNPHNREWEHRRNIRLGKSKIPKSARFEILATSTYADASRIESDLIKTAKAAGECQLNRNRGMPRTRKTRFVTYEIVWPDGALTFTGPSQAARFFGVNTSIIRQSLRGDPHCLEYKGKPTRLFRMDAQPAPPPYSSPAAGSESGEA